MGILNITQAAAYAGVHPSTIQFYRDFGSLVVIRFDDGSQGIRETELRRWMVERIEARAAKLREREERRRAKAERYERWLKSQGLQRIAA
jgi:hypothetical protein